MAIAVIKTDQIEFTAFECNNEFYTIHVYYGISGNILEYGLKSFNPIDGAEEDLSDLLPPISSINFPDTIPLQIPVSRVPTIFKLHAWQLWEEDITPVDGAEPNRIYYYNEKIFGNIGRYIRCLINSFKDIKIKDCEIECDCLKCGKYVYIISMLIDSLKYGISISNDSIIGMAVDNLNYYCNECGYCENDIIECISSDGCI